MIASANLIPWALADYLFEAFNILFSMTGSRTSFPTHLPSLPGFGFLPMRQVPSSLCETGNKQGLLPFSSQEIRPRQLLSLLDKEKAQQP